MKLSIRKSGVLFLLLCLSAGTTLADGWHSGAAMPFQRNGTDAAMDNQGRIYIPGGQQRICGVNTYVSTVMRYDETADNWEVLDASLNVARVSAAIASDQLGRIYVIGGKGTGEVVLDSVERFDPSDPCQGWTFIEPYPLAIQDALAVTDSLGRIIVAGGKLGAEAGSTVVAYVFMYDPDDPGWVELPAMLEPRQAFGMAIDSQDRMYAVGGFNDGGNHTDSVERFDPAVGTWVGVDSINSARSIGTATADCNDFIYAIGGWEPGYTCTVERFDPQTGQWETVAPIGQCRSDIASVFSSNTGRLFTFGGDAGFVPTRTVEFLAVSECGGFGNGDANCVTEFCGDSIVNDAPNEACDDGNTIAGDGCSATCQWEPTALLENVVDQVLALNLQQGIENNLDAKLDAAQQAIQDINDNNDVAACNTLQAFINAVDAQRGNQISQEDADALSAAVQEIMAALGCS